MGTPDLIVGVDVAKDSVTVALWQQGQLRDLGTLATPSDGRLPAALVAAVPEGATVRLVLEPTGGYEQPVAQAAVAAGWEVWRPNPWQARRWAEGQGVRAKTDPVDARTLARFGALGPGRPWQPPPPAVAALAQLLAAARDLATLQRTLANQVAAVRRADAPASVRDALGRVQDQVAVEQGALDATIAAHLAAHAELAALQRRLLTVPGIGPKTVLPLLVLLASWDALTQGKGSAKQLTAFVGLDPRPYSSGSSVHRPAHISKRGDVVARTACYQSAVGGARGHNRLRTFYAGLRERGKPAKLAHTAGARKVLIWAWAVYQSGEDFHVILDHGACAA